MENFRNAFNLFISIFENDLICDENVDDWWEYEEYEFNKENFVNEWKNKDNKEIYLEEDENFINAVEYIKDTQCEKFTISREVHEWFWDVQNINFIAK